MGTDQLGVIFADIEDFRHMFQNLISNAVKYTQPAKEIIINYERATLQNNYAKIHVLSESIPIRPEEAIEVFRFGYRAISARNSSTEGEGYGLAIARRKARLYHGDIVYSHRPPYIIFSILIPSKLFRHL